MLTLFALITEAYKLFHILTTLTEKEYFPKLLWHLELTSFRQCPVVGLLYSTWDLCCALL